MSIDAMFYVAKDAKGCLLSFNTASQLGIIKIINAIVDSRAKRTETLLCEYDCLFHEIGKL